jgi:carboxypeptidase C (cathepsin A)
MKSVFPEYPDIQKGFCMPVRLPKLALASVLSLSVLAVAAQSSTSQSAPQPAPTSQSATQEAPAPPAQPPSTPPAPAAKPPADTPKLAPLPADKSVAQTVTANGKTLHYTATVGTITLKAADGKSTGDVTYVAYVLDTPKGQPHNRPVTFAFNGGPGAASVYLNLGAIGPKRVTFANEGDSPSDPALLADNAGTWLDFTDLVFIDPIGTGFSRSLVDEAETKKLFYAPTPDVEYLSLVVYQWLVKNERMLDKKYLVGESYGGYRGPRIAYYLQGTLGVAMNGIVLVSPYLNPQFGDGNLSPIPWMTTLPSITAAHLESEHKLTDAAMAEVIAYTRGDYATTLLKGRSDPAATDAMIARVTQMTGLDPKFVKYSGGRLDIGAYLREVHRSQGLLGSVYDSNVTGYDPFPFAPEQQSNDPILAGIIAPTTTAMVDFFTRTVGWKTDNRFNALSYEVNQQWDRSKDLRIGSVPDLRQAVAADPKLRVLIVHGWNDLSCPFMGSVLSVDQMPLMGDPKRVQVHEFPGGHMFYTRASNLTGLHQIAEDMVAAH